MKKYLAWMLAILLCLPLLLAAPAAQADDRYLEINTSTFPDAVFRDWVIRNLPVSNNLGFYMTQADVMSVKRIECADLGIRSLKGVEHFTALETLDCSGNELTALDVGENPALQYLFCYNNAITALQLKSNPALKVLRCNSNPLGTLDLSDHSKLEETVCGDCALRSLNLQGCYGLFSLDCTCDMESELPNDLGTLDLSDALNLESLSCGFCGIASLDVSENANLKNLICYGNGLRTLDLSKNPQLLELNCTDNLLTSLDVSKNGQLVYLFADRNHLKSIDVTENSDLAYLYVNQNDLTAINVSCNSSLLELSCDDNHLTNLDVSNNRYLRMLSIASYGDYGYDDHANKLDYLDLSQNFGLELLDCSYSSLRTLDVSNCDLETLRCSGNNLSKLNVTAQELYELRCDENNLGYLVLDNQKALEEYDFSGQVIEDQKLTVQNGKYVYDLTKLVPVDLLARVSLDDAQLSLDTKTGLVTFPRAMDSFTYRFRVNRTDDSDITLPELPTQRTIDEPYMDVTVLLDNSGSPSGTFQGTVEWNASDVKFKGATPYVLYNGKAQTPRFTVKDKNGNVVDSKYYTYQYRENTKSGTAYLTVTMKDGYTGTVESFFKIYLPATTSTTVENVADGIKISWSPVQGAAGYVIYRRAWSTTTNGWTTFARWMNVTGTTWTDGTDDLHKVYAGTRYQYGIKAYFAARVDPTTGETIGGNQNNNNGNFNLGIVGPLKTTVRITTRTLNSVIGGSKQLTVKWTGSKIFTGYEVQIATNSAFTKNVKTVTINKATTYETTIKSLKAKTTYYVRVRSYHVFEGTTYYGQWSNVKSAKTK